jgi:predicted DNA-binding transcriptional regulator AlpA
MSEDLSPILAVLVQLEAHLKQILDATVSAAAPKLAFDAPELSRSLGISRRHLDSMVGAKKFPAGVRLGNRVVWPAKIVEKFLLDAAAKASR